jgi:outer membrane protein assembly factor BamE (lipoprotein component of BamABCDE complex)
VKIIYAVILLLTACSISELKFDKSGWNEKSDISFINRENMVNDLMMNHLRKGMSYNEVISLIGQPENYNDVKEKSICYEIMEYYGFDIDPIETKTLIIEMSKDSIVLDFKLDHWKK